MNYLLALGVILALGANLGLLISDFYWFYLLVWLLAILVIGIYFFKSSSKKPRWLELNFKDLLFIFVLLIIFSPLYLYQNYQIPWQINSDEIVISSFVKELTTVSNPNILGISGYFGFPTLTFFIFGHLAKLLGEVDLTTMRLIHSLSGLLIIALSYFFFRLFFNRVSAFSASLVLGSAHSLMAISRMAMRDNTGLLVEIVALLFLFIGYKNKNLLASFLGGVIAGLGFYTYFPGRIVLILWFVFLFLLLLKNFKANFKSCLKIAAPTLLGFVIVVAPVMIDSYQNPELAFKFAREQTLLTTEGRQLQQSWAMAKSVEEGLLTNITNGLAAFNNKVVDQGWIYPNRGFGFLDPLSGVLLWIGVVFVFFKLKKNESNLFFLSALLIYLITFSFLVNKAPNYTRLLVTLPIISFFIIVAAESFGKIPVWLKIVKKQKSNYLRFLPIFIATIILFFNFFIFDNFVKAGVASGNDIGGTGRVIAAKREISNIYLINGDGHNYYAWGDADEWQLWMNFFKDETQKVTVVAPQEIEKTKFKYPALVFTTKSVEQDYAKSLRDLFGKINKHNITSDGRLFYFETKFP